MNRIDFRIIALRLAAMPIAVFICVCSCALTCRFLLLGEPTPSLAGAWWRDPAALAYMIKLSGGIAVSTAQVFGLAIYKLQKDIVWWRIYVIATAVSVAVSVLTFQSMIQSGAVHARHNSAEYKAMTAESARLTAAIDRQRAEKERIVSGLLKYDKLSKSAEVGMEYETRIAGDEKKLAAIQQRLADYTASTDSKEFVSAATTYDALGSDVVSFFGMPDWLGDKLAFLFSYAVLIAVALAIDLTGTRLFAFALGEAREDQGETAADVSEDRYDYRPFNPAPSVSARYTYKAPHTAPLGAPSVQNEEPYETCVAPESISVEPHRTGNAPQARQQEMVQAYKKEKSYNGVFRALGIGKNAGTLAELKEALDRYGIPHGNGGNLKLVVSNRTA